MKQLEKKDLINGEIYICNIINLNKRYLIKKAEGLRCINIEISPLRNELFHYGNFSNLTNQFFEATPEEKHWLEVCIAANSFISYGEAMKTFIPEYVECIYSYNNRFIENKIYKVLEYSNIDEPRVTIDNHSYYKHLSFNGGSWKFKPSTKEAYDAQFVVKEPEFVLPEKWCLKITNDNLSFCKTLENNELHYKKNYNYCVNGYYSAVMSNSGNYGFSGIPITHTEITFEQFKKYVLKEQLEEPKDKILEKEGIDLNIGKIIKVESSEGAIYQIGDKIQIFGGFKNPVFKNKKYFTIQGFRWSKDKSKICAVFNAKFPNGIGLDKIELYSEPIIKELSLLEQAKLKYPIGTKVKSIVSGKIVEIKKDSFQLSSSKKMITYDYGVVLLYDHKKWAKIVEDFKLPETWWITIENEKQLEIAKQYFSQFMNHMTRFNHINRNTIGIVNCDYSNKEYLFNLSHNTKSRNPQITFEQFEQYVLHNGFKVGDRFTKQKSNLVSGTYIVYEKEIIDLQYINNESVAFYKMTETSYSGPHCRILTKNIVK